MSVLLLFDHLAYIIHSVVKIRANLSSCSEVGWFEISVAVAQYLTHL